jgi:hypothetical protein
VDTPTTTTADPNALPMNFLEQSAPARAPLDGMTPGELVRAVQILRHLQRHAADNPQSPWTPFRLDPADTVSAACVGLWVAGLARVATAVNPGNGETIAIITPSVAGEVTAIIPTRGNA